MHMHTRICTHSHVSGEELCELVGGDEDVIAALQHYYIQYAIFNISISTLLAVYSILPLVQGFTNTINMT